MPGEFEKHEGTWLQFPYSFQWKYYALKLEHIWFELINYLHEGERVHIVVSSDRVKEHVDRELHYHDIGTRNVDYLIARTNDVWARDNGPTFVIETSSRGESLKIVKWNFNGWGDRYEYYFDAQIPSKISKDLKVPLLRTDLVTEGGNIDVNGKGDIIVTKSAVLNPNRNPNKSQEEVEKILHHFLGVDNFLWLTGVKEDDDVHWTDDTDMHVDILARFVNKKTIVYSREKDKSDPFYPILHRVETELKYYAKKKGFILIPLPMPKNGVYSVSHIGGGGGLLKSENRSRTIASYTNFYIANDVVLMPVYGNVNDETAREILQELFLHKIVVPINVVDLVENGGEIHCVTQQQPLIKNIK